MNESKSPSNSTHQNIEHKADQGLVMIVDDNPDNLRTLKSLLEDHGYETRAAISAELALEAIIALHPDLILLDIMMPEMDGYEVCRQLKNNDNTSNIPVLFISAMNETMDIVKAFEVGGVDYIQKPFQAQEVLARTDTHIALAKTQYQLQQSNLQLKNRKNKLESLNKELSAFAYSVSHDLRAPLRSIDGFSLAILEDYVDVLDDAGKEYLQRIRKSVKRMGQLIDDMLQLSKVTQSELSFSEVDLSKIAQNIVEQTQADSPDRNVKVDIMPNMKCYCDERSMTIALDNLFNNAWKFTSKTPHSHIQFAKKMCDGKTVFYICDNGVGFDMRYANKLFDAFQRLHTDSEFEGTGIGLATVNRIMQLHGGRIWAESEGNKGAIFYFCFDSDIIPNSISQKNK